MSERLRVLHILSGDLWAGAEVATSHLLCALADRPDTDVAAIVLNEGILEERLREAGVDVDVAAENELGFWGLRRVVRERARTVDLLHTHRYKENLLAALSGRPYVMTQHGRPEAFQGSAGLRMHVYRSMDAMVVRRARRSIAVSNEVKSWLSGRAGAERIQKVWNGIADPAERIPSTPWMQRGRRVGMLARLVPVKGLDLAIDTLARTSDVELEIVGEGPELDSLKRRAAASGAGDRIHFVGFDANPLVRLASWRALLVTSHHEGNPVSVLEALALGTPVVFGDLVGVSEILTGSGGGEGIAGLQIPGRDPARWAEALVKFLDGGDKSVQLAAAGRSRYEQDFTASIAAAQIRKLYAEALGRAEDSAPL